MHSRVLSEGANLFVSPGARLQLEKKGVVLYRDASANKGPSRPRRPSLPRGQLS